MKIAIDEASFLKEAQRHAETWIKARRLDGNCNKEEIEALFRKRSEYLNKDCELVWCQSPKDLAKRSVDCLNKNDQFRDQFVVQLRDQFRNQLRDQFWVQLRDQFVVQLRDRFRDHLWDQLWVRSMVQFRGQLWVQFWDQFWDIYYCAYYDFLYNALPVKKFKNYFRFTREAFEYGLGFFLQTRNKIFLLPMPRCFIDDQRRLHREGGPAIEWPDGTKEYYYQGIGVPEELILRPENINPEDILKQRNAAVRGVMMTLTKSRLLKHFPSKLVDKSVWGELYHLDIPGEGTIGLFQGFDPATNDYCYLFVPTNLNNSLEAVAWTYRVTPEEYSQLKLRT